MASIGGARLPGMGGSTIINHVVILITAGLTQGAMRTSATTLCRNPTIKLTDTECFSASHETLPSFIIYRPISSWQALGVCFPSSPTFSSSVFNNLVSKQHSNHAQLPPQALAPHCRTFYQLQFGISSSCFSSYLPASKPRSEV